MKIRHCCIVVVFFVIFLITMTPAGKATYKDNTISGPYTHKNLSIFLIHGNDKVTGKTILTLDEAIEQRKIIIHETSQVNTLILENISNVYIFINSGDIVKGGKQDRVIQWDLLVKPGSGKIPVSSFCVEQNRWSQRGKEQLHSFSSSKKRLASRELKLAAKKASKQGEVWDEVATMQSKLSRNIGQSAKSSVSESSLQLTLENREIENRANAYTKGISELVGDLSDIIGFAFAINGELNSADLYCNNELFKKVWPKMLEACAIEAISEFDKDMQVKAVSTGDVISWFDELSEGKESRRTIYDKIEVNVRESEKNIIFDTFEKEEEDQIIHKNVIRK